MDPQQLMMLMQQQQQQQSGPMGMMGMGMMGGALLSPPPAAPALPATGGLSAEQAAMIAAMVNSTLQQSATSSSSGATPNPAALAALLASAMGAGGIVAPLSTAVPSSSSPAAEGANNIMSGNTLRSNVIEDPANSKYIAAPSETASVSGFTKEKFTNPFIPSYVPPEIFEMESGEVLKAFLARCSIHDITRLVQQEEEASYYQNVILEAEYDGKGNRINSAAEKLKEKNQKNLKFLKSRIEFYRNEVVRDGEVSRKYYFTEEEIPMLGCLFGARGETQKWLVRESGVLRIEFAGKGLTKRQKKFHNDRFNKDGSKGGDGLSKQGGSSTDNEAPHAFIVGYDESAVNKAIEKIRWLLSDEPDALVKREENRRHLAEKDGTTEFYRPREGPNAPATGIATGTGGGMGQKRQREDGEEGHGASEMPKASNPTTTVEEVNEDDDFLDDML